jgi:integrase
MINLVRHLENVGHQLFRVPELIRGGRELVLNGRGIHVRGQAGNGREAIGADVTRTAEALKIPVFHPHELRHTVAGLAITSGADVKVVQPMLGHKSATMRVRRVRPPLWRPTRCCGRCQDSASASALSGAHCVPRVR